MAREGLLISQRGRDGGYQLALPPVDISYGDLVRLTRGSLALVPCASRNAHEHCKNCLPEVDCRMRSLMLKVRDDTAAILDRITLADPIALEPLGRAEAVGGAGCRQDKGPSALRVGQVFTALLQMVEPTGIDTVPSSKPI